MNDADTDIEPIPVRIVGEEQEEAADFGAWIVFSFLGTEAAVPCIPQDRKRKRAVVIVSSAVAAARLYFGSMAQAQQRTGAPLQNGNTFSMESQSPMWVAPDGTNPITVAVLLEGYRAE